LDRERGLAHPRRPEQERARAELDAAAEQRVELLDPALQLAPFPAALVLRRDEPGEYVGTAMHDNEIVITALIFLAPHLRDAEPPPLRPVFGRHLLQGDDA